MLESKRFFPSAENTGKFCEWWARTNPPAPVCGYPKAEIETVSYSGCSGKIDPTKCILLNKDLYRSAIRNNFESMMMDKNPNIQRQPSLRIVSDSDEPA